MRSPHEAAGTDPQVPENLLTLGTTLSYRSF